MQETTFNSAIQADGFVQFPNSSEWLSQLYNEASLKKIDQSQFVNLISQSISFENLENKISYQFKNKMNLIHALTQSTFCYEMNFKSTFSNERLEFLGDSLVNFLIGKNLYTLFADVSEGDLSKLRGALVNEEKLAELARFIGLGPYIFLGKGEFKSQGHDKDSLLADTFEALVAAIYIDSTEDLKACETVLNDIVSHFEKSQKTIFYSLMHLDLFDPKSALQELTMVHHGILPNYDSLELPHNGGFEVTVRLGNKVLGTMSGPSKKKVEKSLARLMIKEKLYL